MNKVKTSERLCQIMNERGLKQVDILNLCKPYCERFGVKMNKSDLSQYCSGKTEPNQEKLFVLSNALGVNEAWLMGFDIPSYTDIINEKNRKKSERPNTLAAHFEGEEFTEEEMNEIKQFVDFVKSKRQN